MERFIAARIRWRAKSVTRMVDPRGPLCICGRRGCVEAMACGPAIARAAHERLLAEPNAGENLRALTGDALNAITGEFVARAANAGDELAQRIIDDAARTLGFGIGTAITLMNPDAHRDWRRCEQVRRTVVAHGARVGARKHIAANARRYCASCARRRRAVVGRNCACGANWKMNLLTQPHRRYNPLTDEWILVSPQRTQRPWLGQVETPPVESRPAYDPQCYLCPGNARAGDERNPQYESTFAFENDFAALLPDVIASRQAAKQSPSVVEIATSQKPLLAMTEERGICRVICFSPRHDLMLPHMNLPDIARVVDVWIEQTQELGSLDFVNYVQIFENKGEMMGASNPHPHCQVWATEHIPTEPAKELRAQNEYFKNNSSCLLCDYLAIELAQAERIIAQNDHFVVVVPFWAVWPFETMLLSRRHMGALTEMTDAERDALADIVKRVTTRYDNLFRVSFPYSMGFHQSPTDGARHPAQPSARALLSAAFAERDGA